MKQGCGYDSCTKYTILIVSQVKNRRPHMETKKAVNQISGRTDLAVELQEDIKDSGSVDGIRIITKVHPNKQMKETHITIENEEGERKLGKPIGNYITIESDQLCEGDTSYHEEMSETVLVHLKRLMKQKQKILLAGLGNRKVTPDSLGPLVVENLYITKHLLENHMIKEGKNMAAVAPGVMAQTGMETSEVIKGIVNQTQPELLIVVDALAARNSNRLNKTIQISDTGIAPGSGVGNHRKAITEETMGIPVIAIGVPTVIAVPTIVNDAMEQLLKALGKLDTKKVLESFSDEERYALACEVLKPHLADMFVTPKNIDEEVKTISYTISEAINRFVIS